MRNDAFGTSIYFFWIPVFKRYRLIHVDRLPCHGVIQLHGPGGKELQVAMGYRLTIGNACVYFE